MLTPAVNYGVSIRGVFEDLSDGYDSSRHEVRAALSPGRSLRNAIGRDATVKKREAVQQSPNPMDYLDINSNERNQLLTPGGMGQLTGHRLKYNPDIPGQGIYLIDSAGGETQVDVVGQNFPSTLVFLVPPTLGPDSYRVQVRASFNTDVYDIRNGELRMPLQVV